MVGWGIALQFVRVTCGINRLVVNDVVLNFGHFHIRANYKNPSGLINSSCEGDAPSAGWWWVSDGLVIPYVFRSQFIVQNIGFITSIQSFCSHQTCWYHQEFELRQNYRIFSSLVYSMNLDTKHISGNELKIYNFETEHHECRFLYLPWKVKETSTLEMIICKTTNIMKCHERIMSPEQIQLPSKNPGNLITWLGSRGNMLGGSGDLYTFNGWSDPQSP